MRQPENGEPALFSAYLDKLCGQVRCKRVHPGLRWEMSCHLKDRQNTLEARGVPSEESEEMAVVSMGDPVETGQRLDRIHRPRVGWNVLVGLLAVYLVGAAIHSLGSMSDISSLPWGNLYFSGSLGYLYTAFSGLLCLLIVRWMDYTILAHWPRIVYGAALALLLLISLRYGGRFFTLFYVGPLMVFPLLGFVYSQRRKGWRGVVLSLLAWGAGLLPFFGRLGAPSPMVLYGLTGLLLLLTAVFRDWFMVDRRKVGALVLGAGIVVGAVLWPICLSAPWPFGRNYQPDPFYQETAQIFLRGAQLVGPSATFDLARLPNTLEHNTGIWSSAYLLTALIAECGWLVGVVVILAVGALLAALARASIKNPNELGSLVSLGCTALLGLQMLAYLLANLGLYVPRQIYLPFLLSGLRGQVVDFLTVGLLLSCWRRKDLLPEWSLHRAKGGEAA